MKYLLLLLIFTLISHVSTESFVRLIGYEIVATPLQTLQTASPEACGSECVESATPCVGFQYSGSTCKLLNIIRNIESNPTACEFFVYDRKNGTNVTSSGLSETDQLVYVNAYLNQKACPQGATDNIITCTRTISVS